VRSSRPALLIIGAAAEFVAALALASAQTDRLVGIGGAIGIGIAIVIGLEERAVAVAVAAFGAVVFIALDGDTGSSPLLVEIAPVLVLWVGLTWGIASFAQSLRRRSFEASEQARRAVAESERLHREILRALVPPPVVHSRDVRVRVAYSPGEQRLEFGGDFFDAVEREDGSIALLIGDVSGHGADAAAVGATLRAGWRAMVMAGLSPRDRLESLHQLLVRDARSEEFFATVCSCVINPTRTAATVISAGHPPPILMDGQIMPLPIAPGPPLGMAVPGHPWQPTTIELRGPFSLLLYTDGIVEGRAAPNRTDRLGIGPLLVELDRLGTSTDGLLGALMAMAEEANGARLPDDVALVLVSHDPSVADDEKRAEEWAETGPGRVEVGAELSK
jgi:serine phosphatase RsbU (regulator of sigma subunit)